jgi:hypothetical protein
MRDLIFVQSGKRCQHGDAGSEQYGRLSEDIQLAGTCHRQPGDESGHAIQRDNSVAA